MNGIEYFRRKKRMSKKTLAEKSGLTIGTIQRLSTEPNRKPIYLFQALAAVLEVTVDELILIYPDCSYQEPIPRKSRTKNPDNCIAHYCDSNYLTLQALASRLGVTSRECARQACVRATPLTKHVSRLAAYEGISDEDFVRRYDKEVKSDGMGS